MWWILLYSTLEATYVLNKSQHGSVLTFVYYEKMPVYETGNASLQPHFLLNVTCLPPVVVCINISIEIVSLIIPLISLLLDDFFQELLFVCGKLSVMRAYIFWKASKVSSM